MPRFVSAALIAIFTLTALMLPAAPVAAAENQTPKVAVIVGPVGPTLTPFYLEWAELTATAAEKAGAVVERAYSPHATPENVLAAVKDANIVVYYGHGWGEPSPYSTNPALQNGWALNTAASTDHSDANGMKQYYGGDWLRANLKPAPGFVMVYAHTCYAPGAPDAPGGESSPEQALARTSGYSQPMFDLGASAYFANDFYRGAEGVVERLLNHREMSYGDVFAADPRYFAQSIADNQHPGRPDAHILQQRSTMIISAQFDSNGTGGKRTDYFMAFAGNPDATPAETWNVVYDSEPPVVTRVRPSSSDRHVDGSAPLTVTFDEDVTGVDDYNFILNDVTDMPTSFENVPITVEYDSATFTATVTPKQALTGGHTYELYLREAISDKTGHTLESPFMARFMVDGTAPALTSSYPQAGHLFPAHHDLRLFADEPLKVVDASAIQLTAVGGIDVPVDVSVDDDGNVLINPRQDLAFGRTHLLRVAEGALTDLAGNPLPAGSWSFGVDNAVTPESFTPAETLADKGPVIGDNAGEGDTFHVVNPNGELVHVDRRTSIGERPGYWFTNSEHYIQEGPTAYVDGLVGRSALWNATSAVGFDQVTIPAGHYVGVTVSAGGTIRSGERATIDEPQTATALARGWINGVPHLLIGDGIWANQWLPEAGMMLESPEAPTRPAHGLIQ